MANDIQLQHSITHNKIPHDYFHHSQSLSDVREVCYLLFTARMMKETNYHLKGGMSV